MKKVLISILFINVLCGLSYTFFDTNVKYLESGNFNEVKKNIDKIKNQKEKQFYYGILQFYLGQYDEAVESVSIYSELEIKNQQIKSIVDNIHAVNEILKNGYEKYESKNFVVYLKGRDLILKDKVLRDLENIYKEYEKIFGYSPREEKVRVEIYNTKKEFARCSTLGEDIVDKTGVVGICKYNRIMLLSPENLPFGYRWVDTLAHEYIHFILNRITEFNLPLYLHEGTARYFDTMYRSSVSLSMTIGNLSNLLDAKENDKIIHFDNFVGSLVYLDSQEQVTLAFNQLSDFVDYLISNYGVDKYKDFLFSYKNKTSGKENYYKIFLEHFDDIYKNWLLSLETKKDIVKDYKGAKSDIKFFGEQDINNLIGLNIEEYIKLGDKYYNIKNYKIALYQYEKALSIEPYNPVVMTKVARVNMEIKKYSQVEKILLDCININPNYVSAYELLFEFYYLNGQFDKIIKLYEIILDINPFNYNIRKKIAEVYSDLGKINAAIIEYEMVKILVPDDAEVNERLNSLFEYIKIKGNKK